MGYCTAEPDANRILVHRTGAAVCIERDDIAAVVNLSSSGVNQRPTLGSKDAQALVAWIW